MLHETQKKVVAHNARFKVLCCGRGWGKTHLAIEMLLWHAVNGQGKVIYIAPTFQQARDIAWQRLIQRTKDVASKRNESRLELTLPNTNGTQSLVMLRGWESVETLRGQEFDFIVVDEVASMRHFWVGWEEVLRPTLRVSEGDVVFISTPKGFNHFFDLYNTKHSNWSSFHFTSYDNPHLPKDEIEEAKKQLTEDRFAQEYLADFRKQEGLVYKEFDRDTHLFDDLTPLPHFTETIGAVDFGHTNPAAVLTIKKDYDGHYWIFKEWYHTGKTDAEIAEYTAAQDFNLVYPDPENAAGVEELRRSGINIRDVNKGKDSVVHGINQVRECFKQNRIHIHVDCQNLIAELETYHYPDEKDGENQPELPVKDNDHALDALRYAIMMNVGTTPEIHQEYAIYNQDFA